MTLVPESRKVLVWHQSISSALSSGFLSEHDASRLPVARSRIRQLYHQALRCGGKLCPRLVLDLRWWSMHLLHLPRVALPLWSRSDPVVVLYSDAEGFGGLGAVMSLSGERSWLSGVVAKSFSSTLLPRKTQIFAFEALMVLITLKCYIKTLRQRRVLFFVDNSSALRALRKGSSRSADVHLLVEEIWRLAGANDLLLVFRWVPFKLELGRSTVSRSLAYSRCSISL